MANNRGITQLPIQKCAMLGMGLVKPEPIDIGK